MKPFIYIKSTGFILLLVLSGNQQALALSAADALNNSWGVVCQNPTENDGSDLNSQCRNILGGSGPGGTNAANANGAEIATALGNASLIANRQHHEDVDERLRKLKKDKDQNVIGGGDILSGERFGFFVNGKTTQTERGTTKFEAGYDSELEGFSVGMDYRFTDDLVAGLAVGYSSTDIEFSDNITDPQFSGVNSNLDFETISTILYGNYFATEAFSIDAYLGWSGVDFDKKRNIAPYVNASGQNVAGSTATSDTDANKVLAGMNFTYGMNYQGLSLNPHLQMDYSSTFVDGYSEKGGAGFAFDYDSQQIDSFKTSLGLETSYPFSFAWGVLIPRVQLDYVHEFLDSSRTIHMSLVQDADNTDIAFETDSPDRDYMLFSAGVSAVLTHGVQMYVDYERIDEHRYLESYTVSGGVRVSF